MTDEPTDEALENLFVEETGFATDDFPAAIFDFARAVLAKWGSPVVAGEPQPSTEGPPELWLQLHGDCAGPELSEPVDYTAGDVTWCWHSIHDSDVRYVRADLATTPQPTQAVPPAGREPLTDAQIAEMMRDTWGCASIAPRHALEFARVVERAHGIKQGGQHGTE